MTELRHANCDTNGINMHYVEAGPADGPVVLMCHGFPESWYSWRHQLPALADAGYRAIAPDMRGYGQTDAPADQNLYTALHHVGDMVGLLDAVGASSATIVGHDWGAPVAWHAALLRPDLFPAVASLSVPFTVRGAGGGPVAGMRMIFGDNFFYFLYFQEPGVAEAELDARAAEFLRGFYFTISGDASGDALRGLAGGEGKGLISRLVIPEQLPAWLTEDDLAFYVREFERTGFRGGLNWYRCADLTWELTGSLLGKRVEQPALFVAGERDPVIAMIPGGIDAMKDSVPGMREGLILPDAGHWTQQERPDEVNDALLRFLAGL